MQRYFINELDLINKKALLEGNDFHHIKNVMRGKLGTGIIVCDNSGTCFKATITEISTNHILVDLDNELVNQDKGFSITIAQSLIRRERFELMLQKSTELGVDKIIPITTRNTIIKVKGKEESKIARWNKITKEASEQSHRNNVAKVDDIVSIKELDYSSYDICLVAYEKETNNNSFKTILQDKYKNILAVIGPEGGFDSTEIEYLSKIDNVKFIGLGPRILRSETASSYLLSVLSYEYEMSEQ